MSDIMSKISLPPGYGRAIPIITAETITSFLKEKRFYISLFYYIIFPIFLVLQSAGSEIIERGTGIAIYYAQLNTSIYIKTLFLSFFPGQIFLIILSSDQIAGEIESDTLSLSLGKPVYHSEIILGKYFGLLSIIGMLQIPSLAFIYYFNLIRYQAEFPFAFFSSLDEVLVMFVLILAIQSMILALSLIISSAFDRSLYAILTSILGLFILSSFSEGISSDPSNVNYISLTYYVDALLPELFFNLTALEYSPNSFSLVLVIVGSIVTFLSTTVVILRRKELF